MPNRKRTRTRYSREYKAEIGQRAAAEGTGEVAKAEGLRPDMVRRWRRLHADPGSGTQDTPARNEPCRRETDQSLEVLAAEIRHLKAVNETLAKAVAELAVE